MKEQCFKGELSDEKEDAILKILNALTHCHESAWGPKEGVDGDYQPQPSHPTAGQTASELRGSYDWANQNVSANLPLLLASDPKESIKLTNPQYPTDAASQRSTRNTFLTKQLGAETSGLLSNEDDKGVQAYLEELQDRTKREGDSPGRERNPQTEGETDPKGGGDGQEGMISWPGAGMIGCTRR